MSKEEIKAAVRNNDPSIRLLPKEDGKSNVWKRFRLIEYNNVIVSYVACIECKTVLAHLSKHGTGSLARHKCAEEQSRQSSVKLKEAKPVIRDNINETLDDYENIYDNNEDILNETLNDYKRITYDQDKDEDDLNDNNEEYYSTSDPLNKSNKKFKKEQQGHQEKEVDTANKRYHLHQNLDSYEHLGLAWAEKLRKMPPLQSKLAQRLIGEIMFQGEMDMLRLDTTVQSKTTQ
ncbi:uncharacterized protein [Musca autumnalis]|uniref:uncharacterized protein n=1 Tax=Musca autumnalis TaxID=221902 RepID=UPI003CE851D2